MAIISLQPYFDLPTQTHHDIF